MDDKKIIFQDFARKAKERIEEKKKKRTKKLYVGDIDMTLTIRGISNEEYLEIVEMDMTSLEQDRYLIYYACEELQKASAIMVEEGSLSEGERYKITEMFEPIDRSRICTEILQLSGLTGDSSVKEAGEGRVSEVDEVKN